MIGPCLNEWILTLRWQALRRDLPEPILTHTVDITGEMVGAWPLHDDLRTPGDSMVRPRRRAPGQAPIIA